MTWLIIIILILVGLLFIILEVLVVPGLIMGLIGVSLLVLGVYESYSKYGSTAGNLTVFGTVVLLHSLLLLFSGLKPGIS